MASLKTSGWENKKIKAEHKAGGNKKTDFFKLLKIKNLKQRIQIKGIWLICLREYMNYFFSYGTKFFVLFCFVFNLILFQIWLLSKIRNLSVCLRKMQSIHKTNHVDLEYERPQKKKSGLLPQKRLQIFCGRTKLLWWYCYLP